MRHLGIILAFLLVGIYKPVLAQNKYITKTGHISFFSEAPLENIEAHNRKVVSIINLDNSEVVASMLIKAFDFEKSLMQEHFNENYMESDKYPKASFVGTFTSSKTIEMDKDGVYPVTVSGKMTIHGVTNPMKSEGTIEVKGGQLLVKTKFEIALKDYEVKIPKLVIKNIAEIVEVTVDLAYDKHKS